eukprot:352909-Chlamydomonas_euryale.AAC.6
MAPRSRDTSRSAHLLALHTGSEEAAGAGGVVVGEGVEKGRHIGSGGGRAAERRCGERSTWHCKAGGVRIGMSADGMAAKATVSMKPSSRGVNFGVNCAKQSEEDGHCGRLACG